MGRKMGRKWWDGRRREGVMVMEGGVCIIYMWVFIVCVV